MSIIEKAKSFFHKEIERSWLADSFKKHLGEFEGWADIMLRRNPEADQEIVLLGMWLHDIGFSVDEDRTDHAVTGEALARKWLSDEGYDPDRMERVLHCIRSHRCKDVMPETLEARIIAFSDSASHISQGLYLDIVKGEKKGGKYDTLQKLERDWRDLSLFPDIKDDMTELYEAWKRLIEAYRRTNI